MEPKDKPPVWSWGPRPVSTPATQEKEPDDDRGWWWDRYKFDHRTVSYDSKQGSASWRSRLGMMDDEDSWDMGFRFGRPAAKDPHRAHSRALNQLQGSANIMGGKENRISVRWSNGRNANSPTSNQVHLSPDGLLDENGKVKDEAIDGLTGKVYMASTLRETVHPDSYAEAKNSRRVAQSSDVDDCAVRIWEALETSIARHSILENWGGFAAYIAKDEELTIAPRDTVQAYLDKSEAKPNAIAASVAVAWNLLHPHDRVKVPDVYDPVLDLVAKALAEEIPANERFTRSRTLAEEIRKILAYEEEDPPESEPEPEDEDNSNDEQDEDSDDDNEGEDDDKEESEGDGGGYLPRSDVPCVTDSNHFGGRVANVTDTELAKQVPDKEEKEAGKGKVDVDYDSSNGTDQTTWENMGENLPDHAESVYQNLCQTHSAAIRCVRDSLFFHHNAMNHPTYGHMSGDIDEGNLFKLTLGDDRVMQQNEIESRRSIAICLLVDESGSMSSGRRYEQARDVALILSEGLSRVAGITVDVYGHTAEEYHMRHNGTVLREYRTPRNNRVASLACIEPRSENHDGYAIQHVANRFAADRVHAERRLMFVISDGEPLGSWYRGERAIQHVSGVVHAVRAKLDVQVYGIGVDNAYTHSRGRAMYGEGNFVVLNDVVSAAPVIARFVRQVASAMKRKVA